MYDLVFANGQLAILKDYEVVATFEDRIEAYQELARLNADS